MFTLFKNSTNKPCTCIVPKQEQALLHCSLTFTSSQSTIMELLLCLYHERFLQLFLPEARVLINVNGNIIPVTHCSLDIISSHIKLKFHYIYTWVYLPQQCPGTDIPIIYFSSFLYLNTSRESLKYTIATSHLNLPSFQDSGYKRG